MDRPIRQQQVRLLPQLHLQRIGVLPRLQPRLQPGHRKQLPAQLPLSLQATTVTDSQYQKVKVKISDSSVARYLVQEQLARLSVPNDAVGETPDVSSTIVFDQDGMVQPESSIITVDLRALQSDEERRDDYIRENSLESNVYTTAEFVVREVTGLPWPLPENGDVTVQFGPDDVTGRARTAFTFNDFDMNKPSLFFIVSVEDQIRLEMDFNASIAS
jgi:polyisoprenoid-binding protein YceI